MAPSLLTTSDGTWSDASLSPHGTETIQRTRYRFSAIDNKRSLEYCCPYHASKQAKLGQRQTGTDRDTVKLPRESERKSLVELNPDLFPPIRKSMGSVYLAMLDEFGSDKPYKKGGKGRQEPPVKRISTAQ